MGRGQRNMAATVGTELYPGCSHRTDVCRTQGRLAHPGPAIIYGMFDKKDRRNEIVSEEGRKSILDDPSEAIIKRDCYCCPRYLCLADHPGSHGRQGHHRVMVFEEGHLIGEAARGHAEIVLRIGVNIVVSEDSQAGYR